jgi:hypothetical protein
MFRGKLPLKIGHGLTQMDTHFFIRGGVPPLMKSPVQIFLTEHHKAYAVAAVTTGVN